MIYDGLRIVDCTTGIAGAYCAKLLTDLGADLVFAAPIADDPLFTYLRTSQRHAADVTPWDEDLQSKTVEDRVELAKARLPYEQLDQLTMEVLMGVR